MNFYLHKYGPEGAEHFHLHHDDINMTREQAISVRDRLNELLKMMDAAQGGTQAATDSQHTQAKMPNEGSFMEWACSQNISVTDATNIYSWFARHFGCA